MKIIDFFLRLVTCLSRESSQDNWHNLEENVRQGIDCVYWLSRELLSIVILMCWQFFVL